MVPRGAASSAPATASRPAPSPARGGSDAGRAGARARTRRSRGTGTRHKPTRWQSAPPVCPQRPSHPPLAAGPAPATWGRGWRLSPDRRRSPCRWRRRVGSDLPPPWPPAPCSGVVTASDSRVRGRAQKLKRTGPSRSSLVRPSRTRVRKSSRRLGRERLRCGESLG